MSAWTSPVVHPITGQETPAYLHGVITPMFSPCNEDTTLDEPGIRSYTEYLIHTGSVTTLFPRSGLGRMNEFTFDEAKRMIDIVTDQAAGRIPVMPGCGGITEDQPRFGSDVGRYTRESIELCQYAQRKGAVAAVLVVPEMLAGRERRRDEAADQAADDNVFQYYREVAAETDLPIVMYVPSAMARRFRMSPSLTERILTIPAIRGIKISSSYMAVFTDIVLVTMKTNFALIAGDEQSFIFTMMLGGTGVIGQGCSTNPEMLRAVYERMMSLDYPGATRAALDCVRALKASPMDAVVAGLQYLAHNGVNVKPYTKGGGPPIPDAEIVAYAGQLDALRAPYLESIVR